MRLQGVVVLLCCVVHMFPLLWFAARQTPVLGESYASFHLFWL
jgi:hypothetical protein